jgi:curli biogenesis system outer membrane secretion channel CsgG
MLIQALLATNRVVVVEHADGANNVDYVVGVSVGDAGTEHRGVGGAAGGVIAGGLGLGGLGVNRNKTRLAVTFRLINPKTDEVVAAQTVEGSCTVSTVGLGALGIGGGGGAAGGTGGWKTPSLAAAARVCANKIAYLITQMTNLVS